MLSSWNCSSLAAGRSLLLLNTPPALLPTRCSWLTSGASVRGAGELRSGLSCSLLDAHLGHEVLHMLASLCNLSASDCTMPPVLQLSTCSPASRPPALP